MSRRTQHPANLAGSQHARSAFRKKMDQLFSEVRIRQVSLELVHRVFTPVDEAQVGTIDERYIGATSGIEIWMKSRGGTIGQAVVEIASALDMIGPQERHWLLQQLGVEGEDSDATVELAVQSKVLVLVAGDSRLAYFSKKLIDVDWENRRVLWDYFVALCKAAKAGNPIDTMSFDRATPSKLKDWKSKLVNDPNFPKELREGISAKGGRHTLGVSPRDIEVFTRITHEEFAKWRPPQCPRH